MDDIGYANQDILYPLPVPKNRCAIGEKASRIPLPWYDRGVLRPDAKGFVGPYFIKWFTKGRE
jgi:hypothetical protein